MSNKDNYLQQATSRLDFYFKGYHMWRLVACMGSATSVLLVFTLLGLIFLWGPQDRFIPVGPNGEVIPVQPLSSPNKSEAQLRSWVISAVMECSTFGHHDYTLRLEQCREYFSDSGYQAYRDQLNDPSNQVIERIIDNRQVMSAVASGTPQIIEKSGPNAATSWWKLEIPVTTTFEKGNDTRTIQQIIHVVISRLETTERLSGIGITQWRSKNVF